MASCLTIACPQQALFKLYIKKGDVNTRIKKSDLSYDIVSYNLMSSTGAVYVEEKIGDVASRSKKSDLSYDVVSCNLFYHMTVKLFCEITHVIIII